MVPVVRYIPRQALPISAVFGTYPEVFSCGGPGVILSMDQEGDFHLYRWVGAGEEVEKRVVVSGAKVTVCPVVPFNFPREVTRFLECRFLRVALEPLGRATIQITFPVEIGVFIESRGDVDLLDIFSLAKAKYSLYGPPDAGVLTRWHASRVIREGDAPPDYMLEGLLTFTLYNSANTWVQVSRAVFDGMWMRIFYDATRVVMTGTLKVFSGQVAETSLSEEPPDPGLNLSVPLYSTRSLYTTKNILIVEKKGEQSTRHTFLTEKKPLLMEYGLG